MFRLVIGNKNLSSWSLRPWILLKHLGLEFEEIRLVLDTPGFAEAIAQYSPAGRVPVLIDDGLHIWDSLAICEYLNEKVGGQGWPADSALRAQARSLCAEMHSGFAALRQSWPMNALAQGVDAPLPPLGLRDIARIDAIWESTRTRYSAGGPWLFGEYSIADAMFAPVALRFNTYGATLSPMAYAYCNHLLDDPFLKEWLHGAQLEQGAR